MTSMCVWEHVQGVLRLRSPDFGGTWMPVFDTATEQKNNETFWPVAVTRQALSCVICREHTPFPTVRHHIQDTSCLAAAQSIYRSGM